MNHYYNKLTMDTYEKFNHIFQKEKNKQYKEKMRKLERDNKKNKGCKILTDKMKYLQKNPTGERQDLNYVNSIINSIPPPYKYYLGNNYRYYTKCYEFEYFVKENNANVDNIKIIVNNKYVNYVEPKIDLTNKTITHYLRDID